MSVPVIKNEQCFKKTTTFFKINFLKDFRLYFLVLICPFIPTVR